MNATISGIRVIGLLLANCDPDEIAADLPDAAWLITGLAELAESLAGIQVMTVKAVALDDVALAAKPCKRGSARAEGAP